MDDTTNSAVLAFPADEVDTEGERFFDALLAARPTTVDELVPAITAENSGLTSLAERYRDNIKAAGIESGWPDALADMVSEGNGARLVAAHHALTSVETQQEPASAKTSWADFVAEKREFWATWDGSDWAAWREAFRETGELYGLTADTEAQLAWLDSLATTVERATYLHDTLGFTVHPDTLKPAPNWAELVEAKRDFWAGWDGGNWAAWRKAFRETGELYDLAADTDEQLARLDGMTTIERATHLRDELGFTVHPAAFEATDTTAENAGTAAAVEALPEEQVEALVSNATDTIMDHVMSELPALAQELGIPLEELQAELANIPADDITGAIQEGLSA